LYINASNLVYRTSYHDNFKSYFLTGNNFRRNLKHLKISISMQIRIKTENVIQKQIIFLNTKLSFFVNLTPKKVGGMKNGKSDKKS